MKAAGLRGVSRRKPVRTTTPDKRVRRASDPVDRNFIAGRPNRLWVADITDVPTWVGFLYLSVVPDGFSRRIVGRAMGYDLGTRLVLDALNMAIGQRGPRDVIHHSDRGSRGGFKWSSQHSDLRGCGEHSKEAIGTIWTSGTTIAR